MSLGEPAVKRAVAWILEQLGERPNASRASLIDEAARRFDLTPIETDFLYRQLADARRPGTPGAPD